jgi:excisionase family DNA binding protein
MGNSWGKTYTIPMSKKAFDPLKYIEGAFLDNQPEPSEDDLPKIGDYLNGNGPKVKKQKFRRTEMSAPRPRRSSKPVQAKIDPALEEVWTALPRSVEFLSSLYDDQVTANYYRSEFKETRQELIRRLLDPQLSLEETSRLLGVCPATVRRYTNRGWLKHHRTEGGQRRFKLSDLVRFVETHGRFPEE